MDRTLSILHNADIFIYHSNCADGFTCAYLYDKWCVEQSLKNGTPKRAVEYIPSSYYFGVDGLLDKCRDKYVAVADFSFSSETMRDLQLVSKGFAVFDHHISKKDDIELIDNHVFDSSKCGSMIVYDLLWPDCPRSDFVKYINDRDLWLWQMPNSHEINAVVQHTKPSFESWADIENCINNDYTRIVERGRAVLNTTNFLCENVIEDAALVDFIVNPVTHEKAKALVFPCNVKSLVSDSCHLALNSEAGKEVDFVCGYTVWPDGNVVYSLRSKPHFDCSAIAKAYGGGGHKNASGFRDTIHMQFPWIKINVK